MATINLFQDGDEEVMLCCWNGDVFIVNAAGSQLKFTIPFSLDEIKHSTLFSSIDTPLKRRSVLAALQRRWPSAYRALSHQALSDDDDSTAPTLQQCIRACVYASNSIFSQPPTPVAPVVEAAADPIPTDIPAAADDDVSSGEECRVGNSLEVAGDTVDGTESAQLATDPADDELTRGDERDIVQDDNSVQAPSTSIQPTTATACEDLVPSQEIAGERPLISAPQSPQKDYAAEVDDGTHDPALEQSIEAATIPTAADNTPFSYGKSVNGIVHDHPSSPLAAASPLPFSRGDESSAHPQATQSPATPTNQRRRGRGKGPSRQKKSDA
ncbi:hypothetical protein DYB32_008712 [Aphanomyces invadans]|uniref:Uncharacterized protein n=1 Tax=Aphanomyces invadans TaxID=157072 RepID=A0A418AKH1_9STRA|nr:hypothetical protein DYB32_008712 [Aphanomyces invadans]